MNSKSIIFKRINKFATGLSIFVLSLVSFALLPVSPALAVGTIYLSPANSSIVQGTNVTLQLRISPGTPVTAVQATINFIPSQLQYVGISYSGSPFNQEMPGSSTSSSVSMTRFMLNSAGVSTDSLIASITFKALVSSGSSAITLSGVDAIYGADSTSPSASNASVSFTPDSCPSGQVGTPPNCTTPAPTTPGTPQPSTPSSTPKPATPDEGEVTSTIALEAPTISEAVFQYTVAKIVAKTNKPARVVVKYGLAKDKLILQTEQTAEGTDHTVNITEALTPGLEVFYIVVADDGKTTTQTAISNGQTKGLTLRLGMLDKDLLRIRNQAAVLQPINSSVKSDDTGYVEFMNLSPGDYTLEFSSGGRSYSQAVNLMSNVTTVDSVQASEPQTKAVIYDTFTSGDGVSPMVIWIIGIASALVVASGLGYLLWRSRKAIAGLFRRSAKSKHHAVSTDKPIEPVVIWPDSKTPSGGIVEPDWRSKHEQ